jgi:hypothetical protein
MKRLTSGETIEEAARRIGELIAAHAEWICAREGSGAGVSLRRSECDFHTAHGRLIFSCWSDEGLQVWRVVGWEWTEEKLLLEATRGMGAERATLELIPRPLLSEATAIVSAARRLRCEQLARLACDVVKGAKIERASLSVGAGRGQSGRYARIMLRGRRERIAVTGIVAMNEAHAVDAFLSATLLWFMRACERAHTPSIQKLWFVVEEECVEPLAQRLALLRDELRCIITLFEIDKEWSELKPACVPALEDLCAAKPARFHRPASNAISASAAQLLALAPEAIDVVRGRQGETLRFRGLAFARVRRLLNVEPVWFGIEGARRRMLNEETVEDLTKLVEELKLHRDAGEEDHRHALYKAAPEAWLESLLRRDITRLDPGLIVAPLYAQFRTSRASGAGARPIDLLALRQDGRLVVIELKVAEAREHVLQAADYWRRIETYRRAGEIHRARLFGDAAIADESPLVYLVAPTLRFHRAFQTLAHAITPFIEMYRFDINEDWRTGVRVMRRARLSV